jgi:hypothetical protein
VKSVPQWTRSNRFEAGVYRIKITGVAEGSEWDFEPWVRPTKESAEEYVRGICVSLWAWHRSGQALPEELEILITEPTGYVGKLCMFELMMRGLNASEENDAEEARDPA